MSVIRNPFDREVSMYVYFRDVLATSANLAVDLPDPAMRNRVAKSAELNFRDYIRWLWNCEGTVDVWQSQCYYGLAEGIDLPALRVLRFENLEEDLCEALKLPAVGLPQINATLRMPAAAYYDAHTIDIVRRSYAWMFQRGYYSELDVPLDPVPSGLNQA